MLGGPLNDPLKGDPHPKDCSLHGRTERGFQTSSVISAGFGHSGLKGRVKVQTRRAPAPPGSFRHLQLDYITLPKCKGQEDVLVVVDRFSQWVEAYPTKKGTAQQQLKFWFKKSWVMVKKICNREIRAKMQRSSIARLSILITKRSLENKGTDWLASGGQSRVKKQSKMIRTWYDFMLYTAVIILGISRGNVQLFPENRDMLT